MSLLTILALNFLNFSDGPRVSAKRVHEEKGGSNRTQDRSDVDDDDDEDDADDDDDREIDVDDISDKSFEEVRSLYSSHNFERYSNQSFCSPLTMSFYSPGPLILIMHTLYF